PVTATTIENWEEVIAHQDDIYFHDFEIMKDYIVVTERREGINQLKVIPRNGDNIYYIEFEEEIYTAGADLNIDFNTDIFRFSYTSLTTPYTIFEIDLGTGTCTLQKQEIVSGNFDNNNYATHRIYTTAGEGTKIPMSIVFKNGLKKDGNNPALIYGYGSY